MQTHAGDAGGDAVSVSGDEMENSYTHRIDRFCNNYSSKLKLQHKSRIRATLTLDERLGRSLAVCPPLPPVRDRN